MSPPALIENPECSPETRDGAPLLRLHGVTRRFGPLLAVDQVSLAIERGELLGLLGPNGAGKSTLLAMAAGLAMPDAGGVNFAGSALVPTQLDARRQIGLAPQELALYPDLTARENLRFFGRLYGLDGPMLERQVTDGLASVQLSDRADTRVGTFSGGMKRRLNLAASVVHEPKLLFLDEPTAGVDPQSRNHIFEEVRRLNAAGMTVVYTSHYMEEVASLCRRIAVIDAGRLVRVGPLSELLAGESTVIRFRGVGPNVREAAARLPAVTSVKATSGLVEIQSQDAWATLPALLRLLECEGRPAGELEVRPPTLESVFLKLTGHALRD